MIEQDCLRFVPQFHESNARRTGECDETVAFALARKSLGPQRPAPGFTVLTSLPVCPAPDGESCRPWKTVTLHGLTTVIMMIMTRRLCLQCTRQSRCQFHLPAGWETMQEGGDLQLMMQRSI